ncbi:hypothetical protein BJI49_10765 [Acetobacter pasteurianus]|uniref:hypothetical protein n=1 Tax=Acetobacter pasteurianus TaxID=438 RepID=UPI00055121E7|nr:hypothetical protein [Acetobacter pasteurianus]RCL05379.1 hypothetical protein BJI49_10765 [Acetobacter pasteurianus]
MTVLQTKERQVPREVYQPETIVSMTVAEDEAEAQFGSLMKAVRREKNFDPSLPLTITVEQKPAGYAKSLEECYHVSLKIVALLGARVSGIEPHDPKHEDSSDVLWLSGHPETELSAGRAIFVTPDTSMEKHWMIDDCNVSKVGRNGTYWTVTVPGSEVIGIVEKLYGGSPVCERGMS